MADALLSPAVGGTLWAASAAAVAGASRGLRREADDRKVPLMGVAGAFVFAAQMVNFAVPGTGSSGHLGGGLLLAVLLGPDAALLVMTSVLALQALFFADGGLLALGANVFNLGVVPAYLALPLVFRPLAGRVPGTRRWAAATVLSAVVALQLGAFGVVLETTLSGISSLPFVPFLLAMQPIHLAIGLVEGLATAAVLGFVARSRPEVLASAAGSSSLPDEEPAPRPVRPVVVGLLAGALLAGGVLALFASKRPDGLEWSVERTARASGQSVPGAPGRAPLGIPEVAGILATLLVVTGAGFALAPRRRKPDGARSPESPGGAGPRR